MKPRQLSKDAFAQAIAQGAGRAFLHVKQYGDQEIKQELLDACLHDYIYDHRFDSRRADWLASILDRSDDISFYARNIKTAIAKFQENEPGDNAQLLSLAACLFKRGFAEFKPLLLDLADSALAQECPSTMGTALIDVAGYPGFHKAAHICALDDSSTPWDMWYLFDLACTRLEEKQDVVKFLEEQSARDELICKFWAGVQAQIAEDENPKPFSTPPELTLTEIVESKAPGNIRPLRLRRFGRMANEADLRQVVNLIETTQDSKSSAAYLTIFLDRAIPVLTDRVFELLSAEDSDIRSTARLALSQVKSPVVRKTGLKMLNSNCHQEIAYGSDLMRQNYRSSDAPRLLESFQRLKDQDHIHDAGLSVLDIASRKRNASLVPLLLWTHDTQPCAFCRGNALEELAKLDAAPDQLLFEAQWDCEQETRVFARGALAKHNLMTM